MKKIAVLMILGLFLQVIPSRVLASGPPPPPPPPTAEITGGVIAALFTTFLVITDEDASGKKEAKATGNEFTDLNNKPGFTSLLKQMAGGSLNTVEILK